MAADPRTLFGSSGIPILLGTEVVSHPACVECGSRETWTLPNTDPFSLRPMINRVCDNCGRVTAAYSDHPSLSDHP